MLFRSGIAGQDTAVHIYLRQDVHAYVQYLSFICIDSYSSGKIEITMTAEGGGVGTRQDILDVVFAICIGIALIGGIIETDLDTAKGLIASSGDRTREMTHIS